MPINCFRLSDRSVCILIKVICSSYFLLLYLTFLGGHPPKPPVSPVAGLSLTAGCLPAGRQSGIVLFNVIVFKRCREARDSRT